MLAPKKNLAKQRIKKTIIGALSMLLIFGCTEEPKRGSDNKNGANSEIEKKNSNLFEIDGKVFSIPSPIQTAFLLKDAGATYSSDLMNPTTSVTTYATKNKKALNLGVYGANLGYATIYDQTQDAISYMAVSKRLSSELSIDNLFNEEMIKRFEANLGNQDSLLVLVSDAFKASDKYLKDNKQNDISVLILAGGWVETLYLATQLVGTTDNTSIRNRIGEQKITVKNLIKLLLPFQKDEEIVSLINHLNELKDLYNGIEFTYTYNEPIVDEENKTTTITSASNVKMNDQQLKDISAKINETRSFIIK